MLKYCEIVNEETGLCNVGLGIDEEFYKSLGYQKREVKQSDIDNLWYLSILCPMKTEEEKIEEEQQRIYRLSMTKYDFYKYVCQPYGIDYAKLLEITNSNEEIAVAWHLCERVYRGDEILVANIQKFIPSMTETKLNEIFKTYGV